MANESIEWKLLIIYLYFISCLFFSWIYCLFKNIVILHIMKQKKKERKNREQCWWKGEMLYLCIKKSGFIGVKFNHTPDYRGQYNYNNWTISNILQHVTHWWFLNSLSNHQHSDTVYKMLMTMVLCFLSFLCWNLLAVLTPSKGCMHSSQFSWL